MKKTFSILLLAIFGIYAFTFKTHYCYHGAAHESTHEWYDHDGNLQYCYGHKTNERYHGDCHWLVNSVKGNLGNKNLFPSYYYCIDILKNASFRESKIIPLHNFSSVLFLSPPDLEIPLPDFSFLDWKIPDIRCRGGPPPLSISPRAPPLI